MFYDLDNPQAFVADVCKVLAPKGIWCIQQASLLDMLQVDGFDNICHEHLEYYHLQPLEFLLAQHGLEVVHVEHRRINAGSIRTWVAWKGAYPVHASVQRWRDEEQWYLRDPAAALTGLANRTRQVQADLGALLDSLLGQGKVIDLLGASTKGNTLLQVCGITRAHIRQAWERSPEKVGRFVGTTGIPIVSEEAGRADPPQVLLCGPWQFRDSLIQREAAFLANGGQIIFPLPQVEIVGAEVDRG